MRSTRPLRRWVSGGNRRHALEMVDQFTVPFLDDGHTAFRCLDSFDATQDQDTVSEIDEDCFIEVRKHSSADLIPGVREAREETCAQIGRAELAFICLATGDVSPRQANAVAAHEFDPDAHGG